jgi:hypothetical protein
MFIGTSATESEMKRQSLPVDESRHHASSGNAIKKITIILRLLPATYLRLAVLIANGIPDLG